MVIKNDMVIHYTIEVILNITNLLDIQNIIELKKQTSI